MRILKDLRRLCRLIAEQSPGAADPAAVERLETELTIELSGERLSNRTRGRARQLVRRLEKQITSLGGSSSTPLGRVFCYRCESAECEHATPPSGHDVFVGYHATGRAEWASFTTLCLEHRPDEADALYADPPRLLTETSTAAELRVDQLPAFGARSSAYEVLGQVAVGYFYDRSRPTGRSSERRALTIQIVHRVNAKGEPEGVLNVIGACDGTDSLGALRDDDAQTLADIVRQGERRLASLLHARNGSSAPPDRIRSLLGWLARSLEHSFKQMQRRTKHAQERARDSQRPTQKAREDALRATPERLYIDVDADTFVVAGPRGRTHVFTLAGRHVTSLVVPADSVRRRVSGNRWRRATASEWSAFSEVCVAITDPPS